jgi:hypothetical protein
MKKQVIEYLEKVARSEDQKTKEEFLNIVMRHLFCMPTEPEIFEKLPEKNKKTLIQDAEIIKQTDLWNMLINEMKFIACKRMYDESKVWDDMLGGKFMLYTLDVIEKKINKLRKM